MIQRLALASVFALLGLTAFTAYRNVLSDDRAVRTLAETRAHDAAGCGDCKATRIEGKRGVFSESFDFTMQNGARVAVTCRRPCIAFGDYACTATQR